MYVSLALNAKSNDIPMIKTKGYFIKQGKIKSPFL